MAQSKDKAMLAKCLRIVVWAFLVSAVPIAGLPSATLAQAQQDTWRAALGQGWELYKAGKYAEAITFAKRAEKLSKKVLGPNHKDYATVLKLLALIYGGQGRYAEAEQLYKRVLAITKKTLGPEHPRVAVGLNNLATLYDDQGRYAEAEPLHKRALTIREKAGPGSYKALPDC